MAQLLDHIQPLQRWHDLLETWDHVSARLHMEQPITLSRCSTLPLLMLAIQTLVVFILEMCDIALGRPGALAYFGLTLFWLAWLFIHLEQADVLRHRCRELQLSLDHQQDNNRCDPEYQPSPLGDDREDPHTAFIQDMETI